ncbi:transcriptional regulator [Bordetella avium]|uniref:transcriptional regulator n=1 Tax=Bordetella avium TaxID=521 RepID=UPI000FD9BE91|nr:YdaS family helix-turn-helix protein [Bordetella avium]AZY52815.1 hypothetical protein C0J07_10130 [Bordetella avium]
MNLRTYLKRKGRGSALVLAKQLGVKPVSISLWCSGARKVPAQRCIAIEQATGGAVTRADLRPDDWPLVWPEYTPPRRGRGRAA